MVSDVSDNVRWYNGLNPCISYRQMSSKAHAIFCSKIQSFSQDMRVVLKGDAEAYQILSTLDAMIGISPDLVVAFFKKHIAVPYEKEILSRDESFLRGELHSKLGESDTSAAAGPLENLHHKIHERWETMAVKDKNIIWDYFKLLVVISKRL